MQFVPFNDLERNLLHTQAGTLPIRDLLDRLVRSQIFALFDRDPTQTDTPSASTPLVLNNQTGMPVIALFTHPDRATLWSERFPEYQFGLLVEFQWILRGLADDVGMVINPGWEVGLEMPAEGLAKLKKSVLEAGRLNGDSAR